MGDNRPLAGQRLGVKDIYDTKGLTATWGSISYYNIANKSESNPPSLQRLVCVSGRVLGTIANHSTD